MFRLELTADEFVGRRNTHGALHSAGRLERLQAGRHVAHPDHADDHALFTFDRVDFIAELADSLANVIDLRPGGMWTHRNNHGWRLLPRTIKNPPLRVGWLRRKPAVLEATPLYRSRVNRNRK